MAEIQGLNHSGISVPDVRDGEEFYIRILGGEHCNRMSLTMDWIRVGRGAPHNCHILGDYLFVIFPHRRPVAQTGSPRGTAGGRHAFTVPRARFSDVVERVREEGIVFEGPVEHPEQGPFGESIYFTDPGGNFIEVCWRRDEETSYDPIMVVRH